MSRRRSGTTGGAASVASALVLVGLGACDPLVESPDAPPLVLVSPGSGDLTNRERVLIAVQMADCQSLDRLDVLADGELVFSDPLDQVPQGCSPGDFCVGLDSEAWIERDLHGKADLVVEATCADDRRVGRSAPLSVTFTPYSFVSTELVGAVAASVMTAGPPGTLLVLDGESLVVVDYEGGTVRSRPVDVEDGDRVWAFGDSIYFACAGFPSCRAVRRLDGETLQPDPMAIDTECDPVGMVEGPAAGQVTLVSDCGVDVDVLVFAADMSDHAQFRVDGFRIVGPGIGVHPDGGVQFVAVDDAGVAFRVGVDPVGAVTTTLLAGPTFASAGDGRVAFCPSGECAAIANVTSGQVNVFAFADPSEPAASDTVSPPLTGFGAFPDADAFVVADSSGFSLLGEFSHRSDGFFTDLLHAAPTSGARVVRFESNNRLSAYSAPLGVVEMDRGGLPTDWTVDRLVSTPDGWAHAVLLDDTDRYLVHYRLDAQ